MKYGHLLQVWFIALVACFATSAAVADDDVFKGKLFPPNVIIENQAELGLSKEQFTSIRATVVEVQSKVAEYEWDMQQAYLLLMAEIDKTPIDEDKVVEYAGAAMLAENEVKKNQVAMLVRLKNLLTDEQVAILESKHGK